MKKQKFILLVSTISIAAVALSSTLISVAITNFRKTKTITNDLINSLINTSKSLLDSKIGNGKYTEMTLLQIFQELKLDSNPQYVFDKFNQELMTKLNENKDYDKNLIEKVILKRIDYGQKYSFTFRIKLSSKYLYKFQDISKEYSISGNNITYEYKTDILYKPIIIN